MEAVFFIGLMIVAVTQVLKMVAPQISGIATVLVAFAVGIVVALTDQLIGVTDITIAEGIVAALQAIGMSTLAGKAGGGAPGDGTPVTNR